MIGIEHLYLAAVIRGWVEGDVARFWLGPGGR